MYYSVFIIMGQHFIMETLLSLDTGIFCQTATCSVIMFIASTCCHYVTFLGRGLYHDNRTTYWIHLTALQLISQTVSKKFISLL